MYFNNNNNRNNNNNNNNNVRISEITVPITLTSLLKAGKPASMLLPLTRAKRYYHYRRRQFFATNINISWRLLMIFFIFVAHHHQFCECRYLPTRSHGTDLDKLRELMLQILESSNENSSLDGMNRNYNDAYARSNWLQAANQMNNMDIGLQKYKDAMQFPYISNGRYYY